MGAAVRVVLITGASTGIGKACADHLAGRGFRVYGTSRKAPEGLTDLGVFRLARMDVTHEDSIRRAVDLVLAEAGGIDAVVNNAGLHAVGPLEEMPAGELERSWKTNCLGPMLVCKALVPHFRERGGGRIVNMSSLAGAIATPYQSAYVGSKFALEGMSQVLRAEVRRFGVTVTMINPGDIRHQDCHARAEASAFYEPHYSNALGVAWKDEEEGWPPERIGPLVERILTRRRPGRRYFFGQPVQAPFMLLKRLLPEGLSEWAVRAYYRN